MPDDRPRCDASVAGTTDCEGQFHGRDWPRIFAAMPPLEGMTVLDLGCGAGDQAAALAARGARVIGYDANAAAVGKARARGLPMADFRVADLNEALDLEVQVDGIWCSFTAAYFPDLPKALGRWARHLKPDGWVAVTEVDDLFGHVPLESETSALLDAYAEDAFRAGRYDFRMGRKLKNHLQRAGFRISTAFTLADRELAFDGHATPEVLAAWRRRFARMELLRRFCGEQARTVEEDFMACLGRDDHRSRAQVFCCIGHKPCSA